MSEARAWDMGDAEPSDVQSVLDDGDAESPDNSSSWGRTASGDWKGYKDGGKVYLGWDELTRRWGPVTENPDYAALSCGHYGSLRRPCSVCAVFAAAPSDEEF